MWCRSAPLRSPYPQRSNPARQGGQNSSTGPRYAYGKSFWNSKSTPFIIPKTGRPLRARGFHASCWKFSRGVHSKRTSLPAPRPRPRTSPRPLKLPSRSVMRNPPCSVGAESIHRDDHEAAWEHSVGATTSCKNRRVAFCHVDS